MAVPRTAAGDFLPPQFRLDSVPAREIKVGDRVSWNVNGRAEVCEVFNAVAGHDGVVLVTIRCSDGIEEGLTLRPDTTVNKVEVLRG